jgi:hypothetical protein
MLFTGKIYVTENRKVYTQNISPIFSGGGNKKDLSETEKAFMVPDNRRISNRQS